IASFSVRTDPYWPKSTQLCLHRLDGSMAIISWNACLRPRTKRSHLLQAMRAAVEDQVRASRQLAFANEQPCCCPYTGDVLAFETAHVDHAAPGEFSLLVKVWLAQDGLTLADLLIAPAVPPQTGTRMIDAQQRASWQQFHHRYARLQVISAEANLRLRRQRKATLVELGEWALSQGDMRLVSAVDLAMVWEGLR